VYTCYVVLTGKNISYNLEIPINKAYAYSIKKRRTFMQDVKTYLSTAPVLAAIWFGILAGLLIEINRFFPDALVLPYV
jgi:photosystem I subunit 9